MRLRKLVVAGLVVGALLGGVVSYWASASPDGLNRVAIDKGFAESEKEHGAADSPLAGYGIAGVDAPWLSGAVAGVAGVMICFGVAGAVGLAARRRAGPLPEVGRSNDHPSSPS